MEYAGRCVDDIRYVKLEANRKRGRKMLEAGVLSQADYDFDMADHRRFLRAFYDDPATREEILELLDCTPLASARYGNADNRALEASRAAEGSASA